MEPQTIQVTPDPLPWWRRILRLGRSKADIQRDLERAVQIANANAELAERTAVQLKQLGERFERLDNTHNEIHRLAKERHAELARRRNVTWPKPERSMTAAQLRAAFNVPVDEPLFAAVMQRIDRAIQDALDVVSQPPSATVTEQHRLHLAGGIEHLRLLQKDLLDAREDAERKADSEEDQE